MEEVDNKKDVELELSEEELKTVDKADIYLSDAGTLKEEGAAKFDYTVARIQMRKSQRDFVNSIQEYLGFNNKSTFIRYVLLSFCREQKKILDAKREADIEFTKAFKTWRKKYLIQVNRIKERNEKLRQMAPSQDEGDDEAFTEEELMD